MKVIIGEVRILKIRCKHHYLFGNMEFDFTHNGKPVDTILIAGENGVGKSSLLDIIYAIIGYYSIEGEYEAELLINGEPVTLFKTIRQGGASIHFSDSHSYELQVVFSDTAINYNKRHDIQAVTNKNVDQVVSYSKSSENLAQEIEQLLIDIHDLDANDYYADARIAKQRGLPMENIPLERRMKRFLNAYEYMFGQKLHLKGIDNNQNKTLFFEDPTGRKIPISRLSSGEKQIVYRGGYLLKDKNTSIGAIILIDEPEISLHPEWQKKIMGYYKNIFTDLDGKQTSQIFAVTHSPFIIHSLDRVNDKVIILKKDENGCITVSDNPEYYYCDSVKAVEEAFRIEDFLIKPKKTVYVEGITDERYMKATVETFGYIIDFDFCWIGERGNGKKDKNTGCTALDSAKNVLSKLTFKNMLLYDCDVNKNDATKGSLIVKVLRQQTNSKSIQIGIENALVLDNIDMATFYSIHESIDEKGAKHVNQELEKVRLCDYICNLPVEEKRIIFSNLKIELDDIIKKMKD